MCVGWEAGETEAATTSSKNLIEVGATAETRVWVWSLENIMLVIIWSQNSKHLVPGEHESSDNLAPKQMPVNL